MSKRWSRRAMSVVVCTFVTAAVLTLMSVQPAGADQTVCHDASLARQRTEVSADMTVPKFDPALGTLLEVSAPVQGAVLDTDAVFENVAATAVTFQEDMTYQVTFTSPGGLASPPALTGTIPRVPSQTIAAFDGTLDFLGASAVVQPSTVRNLGAAPVTSNDPATLAAFTGAGTMPFHLATLIGETFTGGGGNVQAQINTYVAGSVQVCYRYAPPAVPPTTTSTPPARVSTEPPVSAPPPEVVPPPAPPVVAPPAFTG